MHNSFGELFRITTFGESHGPGVGVVIDGCPANIEIDLAFIQEELNRRKPGQSSITTQRKETDEFEILSGLFEGKTTGTPITIFIKNRNAKSKDYDYLKNTYRPSHADFTYESKYCIRDHRGGGRASARETAVRVAAGAIAKQILVEKYNINLLAWTDTIGHISLDQNEHIYTKEEVESNMVRCPNHEIANKMIECIEEVKRSGDTIGGSVFCKIMNAPVGLGEPIYNKFHAKLAFGMMSINAARGFEIGDGFQSISMKGSEHNDEFYINDQNKVRTRSNHSGGIQGGITNGEEIHFRVAFKPVATIMKPQKSVTKDNEEVTLQNRGRHDPCVVPRAVPIVEAMAGLITLDFILLHH